MKNENDIKNAEIYFNESLDTVFQKLYSLKDFRNFFSNKENNFVDKYDIKNLFYAILNLHKLLKYCYDNDLYYQKECAIMSGEIIYNILSSSLPQPTSIFNFGLFRLNEINKNFSLFKLNINLPFSDLLLSCIDIVDILIFYNEYEYIIPEVVKDYIKSLNQVFITFSNNQMNNLNIILAAQICNNIRYILKSHYFYSNFVMKFCNIKNFVNFDSERSLKDVW